MNSTKTQKNVFGKNVCTCRFQLVEICLPSNPCFSKLMRKTLHVSFKAPVETKPSPGKNQLANTKNILTLLSFGIWKFGCQDRFQEHYPNCPPCVLALILSMCEKLPKQEIQFRCSEIIYFFHYTGLFASDRTPLEKLDMLPNIYISTSLI